MNEQVQGIQVEDVTMGNKVAVAHAYACYLKERAYLLALTEEAQAKLDAEWCYEAAMTYMVEPQILANYIEALDGKRPDLSWL